MSANGRKLVASALVVAFVQIAFLGWIIAGRAAILRNGTNVLLKVEPIDPRDLLRGDYVSLGYEISNLPVNLISNLPADKWFIPQGRIVVRLKAGADGYWHPMAAWLGTSPMPSAAGEVDIAGSISTSWSLGEGATVRIDYGIGRFYLPEGEGKAIERDMRTRPFGIRAALAKDGTAQIKALVDGDRTLFEEPLY